MSRRTPTGSIAVAVLVVLVVTAGCLGGLGDDATGPDGTTDPASTTDGAGTTMGGEGTTVENGETTAGPGTTPAGEPSDAVAPPFDDDAVRAAHLATVRDAGGVTVRTEQTIESDSAPDTIESSQVARLDLDSGAALVRRNRTTGGTATTYLAPNGTAYGRQVLSTGKTTFFPPDRARTPNVTDLVRPSVVEFANLTDLTYEGLTTRGGIDGYVYEAEGVETARPGLVEALNTTREDLHAYRLVVVLSAEGRVKYAELSVNFTTEGRTFAVDQQVRYEAVGETSVEEPEWVAQARAEAARPDPNDLATERFTVEAPDGRVDQYVTARRHSLDESRALGPQINENPVYRNDFLNQSRVGGLVRVYWLAAEDVQRVRVVFHYSEDEVPGGNESALTVVWDDRDRPLLNPLNSTVHPENDTVVVTITDPDRLERLQGQTMMVLQYEHYVETLADQRIRPTLRGPGVR